MRFPPAALCLVSPLPQFNQRPVISIHPKKKQHKNFNAINTTASPLVFFLVSIAAVCKQSQSKTRKIIIP
jgi:hypothetical protein